MTTEQVRSADQDDRFRGVRPALPVLQADQRALMEPTDNPRYSDEYHLRPGFPNRRAVIAWYQRAVVRTFGHIADKVPVEEQLTYGPLLGALITGDERDRWLHDHGDDTLGLEQARIARERYEANTLIPACHEAYNDLLDVAGEYIGGDDAAADFLDLDPDTQKHVAMRPGFQFLDEQQHRALEELWAGFDNRESLYTWIHGLDQPTNGAIRPGIAAEFDRTRDATRLFLTPANGSPAATRARNDFAVRVLLPYYVGGVRAMSAGELAMGGGYRDQPGAWE